MFGPIEKGIQASLRRLHCFALMPLFCFFFGLIAVHRARAGLLPGGTLLNGEEQSSQEGGRRDQSNREPVSQASRTPDFCRSSLQSIEVHRIQTPGHWMQFGGDHILSDTDGAGRNSFLYDTRQRKNLPTLTNGFDGAILRQGDVVVYATPLRFFLTEDLLQKAENAKPFYTDSENKGNYQSVGQLNTDDHHRVIRVLTGTLMSVADYEISDGSPAPKVKTVTPTRPV